MSVCTSPIVAVFGSDLETMLRSPDLRHADFLAVLRRLLSETRYQSARDFLATIFDLRRSDAEIASSHLYRSNAEVIPRFNVSVPYEVAPVTHRP